MNGHIRLDNLYSFGYGLMVTFERHERFNEWLHGVRDLNVRALVIRRIRAAELGNWGDWKSIDQGVSEIRIHYGAGYRVYFMRRDQTVYLLLGGGDKSTQSRDIEKAIELAETIRKTKL
jgi:putative addiction module killer protein